MATATITIDDETAQAMLARVGGVPGAKAMRQVALAMRQEVYNAFRQRAAPDGTPWPPLSPLTIAARKRRGNKSIQPLVATGDMYRSIKEASTEADATVSIGDGLPDARAWYNQFGTLDAGGHSPARAMLPVSRSGAEPTAEWLARVTQPIHDAIKAATA